MHSKFFSETWLTDRIRRSCQVGPPNGECEVLGAMASEGAATEVLFRNRVSKLQELHASLSEINDPAVELTVGRACADVSRCVHVLRTAGNQLSTDALLEHDEALDAYMSKVVGGDLPALAFEQAALGVAQGGLGFRRAKGVALPAFVASCVEARPFVAHIFSDMAAAGIRIARALELYDGKVLEAKRTVLQQLSPARAERAQSLWEDAATAAQRRFEAVQRGERLTPMGPPVGAGQMGNFVVSERGEEDAEHPASPSARHPRLQRQLVSVLDEQRLEELTAAPGPDTRRLAELADPSVSSEWLWALDPIQPECVEPESYVAAVRLRLGASFATGSLQCRVCRGHLDSAAVHTTCCAPGESTRGHNDVRDCLLDFTRLADATAEKEVLGLLDTAPGLRPADVLTSAVSPGQASALDVGIAAVESAHAGADCTESMRVRKRSAYSRHLSAMEAEGIEYKPLVWSCWGREHPDTTAVLTCLARRAARRRGVSSHLPLLRQVRTQICAALARRSAAMLSACMPAG